MVSCQQICRTRLFGFTGIHNRNWCWCSEEGCVVDLVLILIEWEQLQKCSPQLGAPLVEVSKHAKFALVVAEPNLQSQHCDNNL